MSLPMVGIAAKALFTTLTSSVPALQAGLSVASTTLGFLGQAGAASAQEESNEVARDQARQAMIEDYDQTSRLLQQEKDAAAQKMHETQVEAEQTRATAKVAASAGGVSGLSVDALLGDITGREASIRDSVNQNLEATQQQINMERRGIARNYNNTVNSLPSAERPSVAGAFLEGATGVFGAYKDRLRVRARAG